MWGTLALSEEKGIVGVGPKEIGNPEHRLIFLDIRKGQRDVLIQILKFPICSLLDCYFYQSIPPA